MYVSYHYPHAIFIYSEPSYPLLRKFMASDSFSSHRIGDDQKEAHEMGIKFTLSHALGAQDPA